ncbi:hypothetical protein Y032_0010g1070 [Ancylostoma ceylanicum]|uniref:SCP domain-containing protein n=1 Tax=Ancylostoma ceylanicum TaxID=53326 RepID=A0A016VG63_9BILA|nr:hypothetical protein Y032_0010g1070 [Ancylostoma ceylanicum]
MDGTVGHGRGQTIDSILFVCVGTLLAEEQNCRNSRITPELKRQIVEYHLQRREVHPIEWDCKLEKEAQRSLNGKKVDEKRGINTFKYDKKQYKEHKDIVNFILGQWWSEGKQTNLNMRNANNKKFGCSVKNGKFFHFTCVYEM